MRFKLHYYMLPPSWNHLLYVRSLRSLGRKSERLTNDYITYASTVTRIRQQLCFYKRCKDYDLVPAGLKLKSPLNTQGAIQIVKATCTRLVKARINDLPQKTQTLQRHNNYTTNWKNWYLLNYLTLLRLFPTNVKEKDEPRNRQRAVYKINCSNCHASYIGETGRKPHNQTDWRLTLESWFTNLEQTSLNKCQPIPASYERLIHDINITNESNRTA